jgi:hypothetical protein
MDPGGAQLGDRATHECAPAAGAPRVVSGEGVGLAEIERLGADLAAVERLRLDRHAAVDRERQRQAAVVVRVLADQVDAARGRRHESQRAA